MSPPWLNKVTIPYRTVPYYTIQYNTIPYHTIPHHTIQYHAIPYLVFVRANSRKVRTVPTFSRGIFSPANFN